MLERVYERIQSCDLYITRCHYWDDVVGQIVKWTYPSQHLCSILAAVYEAGRNGYLDVLITFSMLGIGCSGGFIAAIQHGHLDCVVWLVRDGTTWTYDSCEPYLVAIAYGHHAIARYLKHVGYSTEFQYFNERAFIEKMQRTDRKFYKNFSCDQNYRRCYLSLRPCKSLYTNANRVGRKIYIDRSILSFLSIQIYPENESHLKKLCKKVPRVLHVLNMRHSYHIIDDDDEDMQEHLSARSRRLVGEKKKKRHNY